MGLGVFMAILDIQVVATSLPKIREAIDIPPDRMSWIQTAYLIAEVISIPLTGWLDPCAHHARPVCDRDRDLTIASALWAQREKLYGVITRYFLGDQAMLVYI
jgi:hypothetical protein